MPSFLPDFSVIATFALAAFVLAVTPGPDMALFVSRTINWGRNHGFATVMGALTGIAVHTMLVAFGISVLIIAAPAAFWALKIVGALYLVWLAIQAIRDGGGILVVNKQGGKQPSWTQSYLTGLGINLTNPKVALFFVTFLPQFVSADDPSASAKLIFLGIEFVIVSILSPRLSRRQFCRRGQAHHSHPHPCLSHAQGRAVPRHRHPCRGRPL
jgi:threonine/homoserine/homoserine lactone efflux protein